MLGWLDVVTRVGELSNGTLASFSFVWASASGFISDNGYFAQAAQGPENRRLSWGACKESTRSLRDADQVIGAHATVGLTDRLGLANPRPNTF